MINITILLLILSFGLFLTGNRQQRFVMAFGIVCLMLPNETLRYLLWCAFAFIVTLLETREAIPSERWTEN